MEQPTSPAQPGAAEDHMKAWEPPKPEPFKPSHVFSVAKLVVGGFNLGFAIITLGISIHFLFQPDTGTYLGMVILIITAGLSIVWQAAEILTRLFRRRTHRPIHPGAHVAVHLILWVLSALCTATLAIGLAYTLADYTIGSPSDEDCYEYAADQYLCDDDEYDNFATRAEASQYFALLEALVAFVSAMTIAHFVLFVMACVETDQRRKYGKRTKVVYLVPKPGTVDGRTYYTPVPAPQAALMLSHGVKTSEQPVGNRADWNAHGVYAPSGVDARSESF